MKDHPRALGCFLKAMPLSERAGDHYTSALLYINAGSTYQELGQYGKAIYYLEKAKRLSGELGTLDVTKTVHQVLSEIYNASGNHALAFKHYKEYIALRDSLFNEENTKKLLQAEMTFEFERREQAAKLEQEKKDAVADERFKRQQLITWTFAGSGGLVLLFGLVLLREYRLKQKAHRVISEQKKEVEHQMDLVEEKNKKILDSIFYAKRIQQAMLPFEDSISRLLKEIFIFYRPKDIVSGDFYWFMEKDQKCIIAAVDCTGHGVPGAFMSMIGNDLLNDIVGNRSITDPGHILTELNKGIRSVLKQNETSSRDGMDISLCSIDTTRKILQYAGANNPIWIMGHDKEFRELKPDKAAIGGHTSPGQVYSSIQLELKTGDMVYLFTDGYADQFGGPKGKKFKYKALQELLLANSERPPGEQKEEIAKVFESWKGSLEQTDDVTVIGVRL
jgi:serine phosphatase RsbU (regulator of sigma subunit)